LTFNSVDFGATISVTSFCAPFLARKEDLEHLFANAKARVCVQLPTSADNVALPAFAALAVQQLIDISWPKDPQQQTRFSDVGWPDGTGRTHGRTDGRTTVA